MKSLFSIIFVLTLGFCLIPDRSYAQKLQCSQIFITTEVRLKLTEEVIDRLDTRENENLGSYYLRQWKRAHIDDPAAVYLIGAIMSHPRFSDTYTETFFTKGGPLKVGYDKPEITAIFKKILNQPAQNHAIALHRLWVEMNAGGKELQEFYASVNWQNKIVKVSNADGGMDAARIVSYDPNFGEFVIQYARTQKIESITGAAFFERIGSQQVQALGFKNKMFPESEWFKVIAKKDLGPNGSIYYATVKTEVRVKKPGSELTADQLQRQKPADRDRLEREMDEFAVRHYANGIIYEHNVPVMATIPRFLPKFSEVFQIKASLRNGNHIIQYPDVKLVNHILDSMPADKVTSVRLVTTSEFEAVPLSAFVQTWAYNGKLYLAEQGPAHFHDFSLHLLAYLAMPKELALASRSQVKFWLDVKKDKILLRNSSLQKLADQEIDSWMKNFDFETGIFIERLGLSQDHTGKVSIVEKIDPEGIEHVVDMYVRNLVETQHGEGKDLLESIFQQPGHDVRLSPQEIEAVRAIPLLAPSIKESQIPGLIQETKSLLFLQ